MGEFIMNTKNITLLILFFLTSFACAEQNIYITGVHSEICESSGVVCINDISDENYDARFNQDNIAQTENFYEGKEAAKKVLKLSFKKTWSAMRNHVFTKDFVFFPDGDGKIRFSPHTEYQLDYSGKSLKMKVSYDF